MKENFTHRIDEPIQNEAEIDELPKPENDVYVEQLLSLLDGAELVNFLSEQLQRAGFDKELIEILFLDPEDVTFKNEDKARLAWASGVRINVEPNNFVRMVHHHYAAIESNLQSENYHDREVYFYELAKIELLRVFMHEQLHHLTHFIDRTDQEKLYQFGIERQSIKVPTPESVAREETKGEINKKLNIFFRGLNEGLTELMAQELTLEYVRQTGAVEDPTIVRELPALWTQSGAYKEERRRVEELATVFASMTDVPYDTMLKSFYHEYVNNGHLLPPEFESILVEYLPEGLSDEEIKFSIENLTRSMAAEEFKPEDDLDKKLKKLVSFLPEDKAAECRLALSELEQKYYSGGANRTTL